MKNPSVQQLSSLTIFLPVLAFTRRQLSLGELLSSQLPRPPAHGHAGTQQLESLDLKVIFEHRDNQDMNSL